MHSNPRHWRVVALVVSLLCPLASSARAQGAGDAIVYYDTDAIGSVRFVSNAAGQMVERHDYLPFGQEWPSEAGVSKRKFGGKEHDGETSFDYFGARYVSAGIGRFTTVDPKSNIELSLVEPQRWNVYTYVGNRPLKVLDPDGRDWLYRTAIGLFMGSDYARTHDKSSVPLLFSGIGADLARAWKPFQEQVAIDLTIAGLINILGPKPASEGFSLDDALRSGNQADRNGLTTAGRSLQSHMDRAATPFEKVTPNPKALNKTASDLIEQILTDPKRATLPVRQTGRYGKVVDTYLEDGRGVRFTREGEFIGFISR